jgi:hypothetical protein
MTDSRLSLISDVLLRLSGLAGLSLVHWVSLTHSVTNSANPWYRWPLLTVLRTSQPPSLRSPILLSPLLSRSTHTLRTAEPNPFTDFNFFGGPKSTVSKMG